MDVSVVVAFPAWTGDGFQAAWPKRVDARPPFSLHLHGGSVGGQVSSLGCGGREGGYSGGWSGRLTGVRGGEGVETAACKAGISSFGYSQRGCPTIGVMCTLGCAQATKHAAQLGLSLMFCKLSQVYQEAEIPQLL